MMAKVTCESFAETCFFCRYLYTQQRWDLHEEMIHIFNGDGVVNVYSLNSLLRGLTSVGSWSAVIVDVTYAETGDIRITRNDGVRKTTLRQYFEDAILVSVGCDADAQTVLSSNYCSDRFPTGSPIVHVLTDDELDAVRLVEVPEKFFLSKVPYLACIILRYGRISVIHADRSLIHTLSMLSIDDFEDLFG